MAMAGWKTEDMLNGIEGIMNLAAASGEDLATTSDIVTDALTAMGLQASDSGHFADVLAAASSNSNTNVGMMGETFKYVAPVAGALGYNIEDLSQAIGLMANSGIKSTQAGTALRSILTRLAKPPKEAAAAMEKYDISMKNSDGSMKSLMEVMENMRDSLRGLPKDEKAAAAAALGGQEAMSGLLSIVNASDTDFKKLASSIKNADGASEKMANTMNDNLKGSITIAGSALEGFGINVYEKMEKPLKSAVDASTEDINRLSEAFTTGGLNGVVEEAGKIFNDTCDEVDKFGPAAEGIVEPIRDIVNTGGELAKNVLPEVAEGMKFLAKNTKTAIPIVTGLVAAYKELKITKQLGDSTTTLGKAVKNSSSWWKTAQTAIGRYAEQMEAAKYTGRQYNVTLTAGQSVLGLFQRKVSLAAASTNILKAAQEGLTKAIEANPIEAGKENVLTKAGEFVSAFLNVFTSGDVGKQLENLGNKVMSYFGIGVSSKTKDSASAGKANADAANKGAGSVSPITTGQGFGTKFASGIGGLVGKARSAGKGNADAANKGAGSVNPNGTGGKFGTQYSSGVSSKTRQANSGGKSLGNNAKSGAGSVSGHDPGYNFGKGFVGGIGSWIKGAASKAAEMAKAAYKAAKHALDEHSPSKLTRKLGRWFSEGFGLGIDDEAKSAVQSAEAVAEKTVSAIDTEAIADKLKGLDLAEIMPKVYATAMDQQDYIAGKLTASATAEEYARHKKEETTDQLSENDLKRLAKIIQSRPIIAEIKLNEKTIAKEIIDPIQEGLDKQKKLRNMIGGVKE